MIVKNITFKNNRNCATQRNSGLKWFQLKFSLKVNFINHENIDFEFCSSKQTSGHIVFTVRMQKTYVIYVKMITRSWKGLNFNLKAAIIAKIYIHTFEVYFKKITQKFNGKTREKKWKVFVGKVQSQMFVLEKQIKLTAHFFTQNYFECFFKKIKKKS